MHLGRLFGEHVARLAQPLIGGVGVASGFADCRRYLIEPDAKLVLLIEEGEVTSPCRERPPWS
jgi:hypothetical protein